MGRTEIRRSPSRRVAPVASSFIKQRNAVLGVTIFLSACSDGPLEQPNPDAKPCLDQAEIGQEVFVQGGDFVQGDTRYYREEMPQTPARVSDYWIDRNEVTNAQFEAFVETTGYISQAERGFSKEDFPEIASEFLTPGSMVFQAPVLSQGASPFEWWRFVPGANWRHPYGPESSIDDKANYPVVQVTIADAEAYAAWAERRLPSEAEWEYAAKGGVEAPQSPKEKGALPHANFWQGAFPVANTREDGFEQSSPAGCFALNPLGLVDMLGNVWELTSDVYYPQHGLSGRPDLPATGYAPSQPGIPVHTIKGGSYLCAENYCRRYRPEARQPQDAFLASSHIGFRTVRSADDVQ